jgi:hypothetical protein
LNSPRSLQALPPAKVAFIFPSCAHSV